MRLQRTALKRALSDVLRLLRAGDKIVVADRVARHGPTFVTRALAHALEASGHTLGEGPACPVVGGKFELDGVLLTWNSKHPRRVTGCATASEQGAENSSRITTLALSEE